MVAIWPKPLASEPVFYYPPAPPYAGCAMQPGRGVELLRVPGDSLPRALWWGCEEAPPRSGEDMCSRALHMSCSSGARSVDLGSGATPLRRGGDTQRTVVRLGYGLGLRDYRLFIHMDL